MSNPQRRAKPPRRAKPSVVPPRATETKPKCFVSFSTGEPQIDLFFECLKFAFGSHIEIVRTPSALVVGESQHDAIIESIADCDFGIVCLDGLRPNVLYEYGAMRGANKPVLVFKEKAAYVDIKHYFGDAPGLALPNPPIEMDKHFSDPKDKFYESWSRYQVGVTARKIWEAYQKRCAGVNGLQSIPEPKV